MTDVDVLVQAGEEHAATLFAYAASKDYVSFHRFLNGLTVPDVAWTVVALTEWVMLVQQQLDVQSRELKKLRDAANSRVLASSEHVPGRMSVPERDAVIAWRAQRDRADRAEARVAELREVVEQQTNRLKALRAAA